MPETKQFTKSEVEKTVGTGKTVIILHDKVYDVTNFLNEHPGGEEILLDHKGKVSSEDFDDVGHSQDAFELMKTFLIGELVEAEKTHKVPKKGWTTSAYTTKPKKKSSGSMPWTLLAVAIVVAAAFYIYM